MPFPRICKLCGKRFQPIGKYRKLCLECYQKRTDHRIWHMKITVQKIDKEGKSLNRERVCK